LKLPIFPPESDDRFLTVTRFLQNDSGNLNVAGVEQLAGDSAHLPRSHQFQPARQRAAIEAVSPLGPFEKFPNLVSGY
jgi:hypothetical protein